MIKFKDIEPFQDIIVLVLYKNSWKWYLSEKELWIMDYKKFTHAFDPSDDDYSDRFNIPVLDDFSAEYFFSHMKEFVVPKKKLEGLILENLPITSWENVAHIFPSLFLNFEAKKLYSVFQELTRFEEFVPENWASEYGDFYGKIPDEFKYWKINGRDYFKQLLGK